MKKETRTIGKSENKMAEKCTIEYLEPVGNEMK